MKGIKKFAIAAAFALVALAALPFAGCIIKNSEDKLFEPYVKYSDFGAAGDGKTNDFYAIKKAHEYANQNGVSVKADRRAKYYIGAVEDYVPVKTNVDWSGAEFIIDDKSADTYGKVWWYSVFMLLPDTLPEEIQMPQDYSLSAGAQNVGLTFGKDVMLAVFNDQKRDFIRYGYDGDTGWARQEIILVDKNGNVDPSTPIQWDYDKVTKMTAYATDDSPVILRGGKFTTIANDDPQSLNYFDRGIKVKRANVTVKNVEHYVVGEGATGSPYNGFFRTEFASNVVFENCVMTGHKYYNQGTYDTRLKSSNNVKYLNCTQSNDISDDSLWGIMCSDFCKNLYMQGCKLSRFDAHMGVYNATIKDSEIGQHISVTGGGTLLVENVVTYAKKGTWFNRFVTLRSDYGSFFYGDVIIKDCTMYTERGINYVLAAEWYDWDFGYECRYPKNITIDNVQLVTDTDEYDHKCLYIFSQQSKDTTYEEAKKSKNPPVLTEKIIIKNNTDPVTGKSKTAFKIIPDDGGWFAQTEVGGYQTEG